MRETTLERARIKMSDTLKEGFAAERFAEIEGSLSAIFDTYVDSIFDTDDFGKFVSEYAIMIGLKPKVTANLIDIADVTLTPDEQNGGMCLVCDVALPRDEYERSLALLQTPAAEVDNLDISHGYHFELQDGVSVVILFRHSSAGAWIDARLEFEDPDRYNVDEHSALPAQLMDAPIVIPSYEGIKLLINLRSELTSIR
jgi:hypothetical protein